MHQGEHAIAVRGVARVFRAILIPVVLEVIDFEADELVLQLEAYEVVLAAVKIVERLHLGDSLSLELGPRATMLHTMSTLPCPRPSRLNASLSNGWLHADGYAGFGRLYEIAGMRSSDAAVLPGPPRVAEVGCWSHVRRGFFDEWNAHQSTIAKEALERIGALFDIERPIAGSPPDIRRTVSASADVRAEAMAWSSMRASSRCRTKTPLAICREPSAPHSGSLSLCAALSCIHQETPHERTRQDPE